MKAPPDALRRFTSREGEDFVVSPPSAKRAGPVVRRSGGRRRDARLQPIIDRLKRDLVALAEHHGNRDLAKYSPDQPRDEAGRWTSGPPGSPEEAIDREAFYEDKLKIGPVHDDLAIDYKVGVQDHLGVGLVTKYPKLFDGLDVAREMVKEYVDGWAMTSGDSNLYAVQMQRSAEAAFGIKDAAHPYDEMLPRDITSAVDDPDASTVRAVFDTDATRQAFLREMYDQTQADLKANGIGGLWVYRGTSYDMETSPPGTYDGNAHDGKVALQPLSSWSLNPGKALDFAIAGDNTIVPRLDMMYVPADHVLSTPRTGFGCTEESEVVILGGTYSDRYIGLSAGSSGPGLSGQWLIDRLTGADTPSPGEIAAADPYVQSIGYPDQHKAKQERAGLDDLLHNADWPKRTNDRWERHFPGDVHKYSPDQPRDEAGRWTDGGGGDVNARIWEQGLRGSSGRGIAMTEKDVEALRADLKAHPRSSAISDAARAKLAEVEQGLREFTGKGTVEHGAFVSADGKLLREFTGEKTAIHDLGQDPEGKYAGAIFTHSHPTIGKEIGGSLSPNDIMTGMVYRVAEMRAVDSKGTYSLRAPEGGWNASTWIDNKDWVGRVEWLANIRGDRNEFLNWLPTFADAIGATYTVTPWEDAPLVLNSKGPWA